MVTQGHQVLQVNKGLLDLLVFQGRQEFKVQLVHKGFKVLPELKVLKDLKDLKDLQEFKVPKVLMVYKVLKVLQILLQVLQAL